MNIERTTTRGADGGLFATTFDVGMEWVVLAALAFCACGVQEYPHEQAHVDPSNDFGPTVSPKDAAASPVVDAARPVTDDHAVGMAPDAPAINDGGVPADVAPPPVDVGAPPSGVVINIGGATVTKENAIAFIHLGHSNMAGRAIGPTATRPYFFTTSDPRAWMYHVGQTLQPALEPYTANDDLSGTYGGPGTALLKAAVAVAAPDKYFISLGHGVTSAYCSQFLPGALYYDAVMQAPLAIKDRVTFGAIVIMLGITERHGTAADVSGFSGCINQLTTAIRNDVGRPDLPMLLSDYEQNATGTLAITQAFAQSILPQIRMVPSVVSNSALVPTDGIPLQDDHHFNLDGHKMWVGRVIQIMQDKGWFPWGTP